MGETSGTSAVRKTEILAPSSPGTTGKLRRGMLFCGGWKEGKGLEKQAQLSQRIPGNCAPSLRGDPPGGAPRFSAGAADPAGLASASASLSRPTYRLCRHAGHQAQDEQDPNAPHIPRVRLLPAAVCNEGDTKPPAQRPAKPAQKDPEHSRRSDRGSGSDTRGPGRGSRSGIGGLARSSCACSGRPRMRSGTAAPSHLLVLHSRRRAVARGGCSLELLLLRWFTPPRTPSPSRSSVSDFAE